MAQHVGIDNLIIANLPPVAMNDIENIHQLQGVKCMSQSVEDIIGSDNLCRAILLDQCATKEMCPEDALIADFIVW